MKADIHPNYKEIAVTCSCGHKFVTRSTMGKEELHVDICANCHPFYTGKQKLIDTAGRVDRFKKKYASQKAVQEKAVAEKTERKETEQQTVKAKAKVKTAAKPAAKPAKTTKSKDKKVE